jgi:flagellar motor protein MotB
MTDAKHTKDHQALEHYREQATGEPPAHLDALILAAAHSALPAPKPGLWQRWIRACQQPRWQVAFASLVGIALMLTLVQRTPEQVPGYDFAPAAPVAKQEAEAAPPTLSRSLKAPAGAPMAESAAPVQAQSFSADRMDEAKASKRAAAPVKSLDEQLREVLRLQKTGHRQAADKLLADLHKRFPDENLSARLKDLQKN